MKRDTNIKHRQTIYKEPALSTMFTEFCQFAIFSMETGALFKDCLPRLLHGLRNKYFNIISLENMLFSHN